MCGQPGDGSRGAGGSRRRWPHAWLCERYSSQKPNVRRRLPLGHWRVRFGSHLGTANAGLAVAFRIDRNELAAADAAFQYLEQILQANPFSRVYQVLVR